MECPGRVDLGSAGCHLLGPNFDMDWLSNRIRFQKFCDTFNCDTISCVPVMKLNSHTLLEGAFIAADYLESSSRVSSNIPVIFQANNHILLQNNFEASISGDFLVQIGSCE